MNDPIDNLTNEIKERLEEMHADLLKWIRVLEEKLIHEESLGKHCIWMDEYQIDDEGNEQ